MTLEEMREPAETVNITPSDFYRVFDAVQIMKMLDSNEKTRDVLVKVLFEKLDELPFNIIPTTLGWEAFYQEEAGSETTIGIYPTLEDAEEAFELYVTHMECL